MLVAFATSAALAALFLVGGLPLALSVRTQREGYAALAHDSVTFGLVATVLAVTLATWLGVAAAIGFAVAYLALAGYGVYARRADAIIPVARRPDGWAIAAGVVVVAALAVRLRSVNMIPWTSDMGGYFNWANGFVRTGHFHSGFPPLFQIYLAISAKLFGISHGGSTVALCGVLLLTGTLRVLAQLRVPPLLRVLTLVILAVQVHAVWFGSFPASESLHAPLLLTMLSLVITALDARGTRFVVVLGALGIVTAALSLNRATAILLMIPLLVLLGCCAAPSWARYARAVGGVVAASFAGLFVGYVYGVQKLPLYYVTLQIKPALPASVFGRLDDLGAFRVSPALGLVMVALIAAPVAIGYLLSRRTPRPSRWIWPLPVTVTGALIGAVVIVEFTAGEINDMLGRIGWWLAVVAVLGMCVPRAVRGPRGVISVLAGSTAGVFLILQVGRFNLAIPHNIYLYWDRYLFSEYLPCMVVLGALGVSAVYESAPVRRHLRAARPVAAVAAFLVAAAYLPVTLRANSHVLLSGAYAFESEINAATPQGTALLWSASSPDPLPDLFLNSYYAFGLPMAASFGRIVLVRAGTGLVDLRVGVKPFLADAVTRGTDIATAIGCEQGASVFVVDVIKASGAAPLDQRLDGAPVNVQLVTTLASQVELIAQVADPQWHTQTMRAQIWRATLKPGSPPAQRTGLSCRVPRTAAP